MRSVLFAAVVIPWWTLMAWAVTRTLGLDQVARALTWALLIEVAAIITALLGTAALLLLAYRVDARRGAAIVRGRCG